MKTLRLKPCFTQNWEAQKRAIKKTLFNLCQHINRHKMMTMMMMMMMMMMVILQHQGNLEYLGHRSFHTWTPSPTFLYKGGRGLSFQNFQKKKGGGGGVQFFPENGRGFGKITGYLEKRGYLISILASPFQCYLCLSVWCVCVWFIYTISISIICVSQKEPSFKASNQQIWLQQVNNV